MLLGRVEEVEGEMVRREEDRERERLRHEEELAKQASQYRR